MKQCLMKTAHSSLHAFAVVASCVLYSTQTSVRAAEANPAQQPPAQPASGGSIGLIAHAYRGPRGPTVGELVDVSPWGERTSWANGKDVGILWEDLRDIDRVVVVFEGTAPDPKTARLQWWQSGWPQNRIPRDRLSGQGESGWLNIGDWYQGRWRDADVTLATANNEWIYTFKPLNQTEYPAQKNLPVEYRSTMKLRLLFESNAPPVLRFSAFTDSTWKSADVAIEWGGNAESGPIWDGHLEVFNGSITEAPEALNRLTIVNPSYRTWKSKVGRQTSGIRVRIWYTESPNINSFDKTVVTVRTTARSFSFYPSEAAKGDRIFIPMYGVLVRSASPSATDVAGPGTGQRGSGALGRLANNPVSYGSALREWKARTTKPIYERVFDESEQTYARARADMPAKRQFYMPLGCEGGRQRFGVEPDGSVFCVNDRIDRPRGKDTARRTWGGNRLRYTFGLPSGTPADRWIEDGCLPIIHARWERDGIRYTQTAFATRLHSGGLGWPDMHADDTTVLMMKIECENTSDQPGRATLDIALTGDGGAQTLSLRDGLAYARLSAVDALRYAVEAPSSGFRAEAGKLRFSEELAANAKTILVFKIPFITLDQPSEIEQLKAMNCDTEFARVKSFWTQRADQSCQIHTPVNDISHFYRALVSHLMINCGREVNADRLMARVGSFSYGVYGNESCMMITDLDRRGFHQEAERCLETFLHYQGTSPLPGDYDSQDGVFNGAGGWESGGYNQHHGWILWAMAEHYWYSGDKDWLNRNADKLIKACHWIIKERARSQAYPPNSLRGIERGLLPQGSLEDIGDWRCWLSNNVFSWWGLDAVARVLADINHPEAKALLAEAAAYRADMLAAFKEGMVRSPVVRLRDGSYIPMIPSEVHRRGRTFGWITQTLEGAIYLIRTGALEPNDPLAQCIMQDYEDNLYLSEQFGYSPRYIPQYWFSRGGFSQQPNLLCSPHPYLLRDEIKHFLRSYFNSFAVDYYQNTQMFTEHPLPDLGDWRGDHYKSSDESNSSYWLRLMFVEEQTNSLYLGMAIPRAWLKGGGAPAIERASTYFGNLSLKFESHVAQNNIQAQFDPPTRRTPAQTYLRFRHPDSKPIRRVTIDGKSWRRFDPKKEWVELPRLTRAATVIAYY